MASIFRRTYKRPIPDGAEIVTRKGAKYARWKDKRGRTKSAPLAEDGKQIVLQYRQWYIEYEGEGGRRVRVKGYTDREATEQLARDKVKLAERIQSGAVTVDMNRLGMETSEAIAAWTADLVRRGKSAGYVYNIRLYVTRMAEACDWPTLGSIRSDSLIAWLADLQSGARHISGQVKTLAPTTLNLYLDSAQALIRWCMAQRPPWMPQNPLEGVAKCGKGELRREKRALILHELVRLKKASGKRWVIYLTAALTGLRRSELKRLQWGDVHLDAEHPYIQLRAIATKARRGDVIPINPELLEALREHRGGRKSDHPTDPVFKSIPNYAAYRKDVEVRAKIPWRDAQGRLASFHCLRKTFGTYLALADVPLRVAMEMMRVTDAKLLTNIYTDAKLLNTSAAAARLPRLVTTEEIEGETAAG
jgi:integrase